MHQSVYDCNIYIYIYNKYVNIVDEVMLMKGKDPVSLCWCCKRSRTGGSYYGANRLKVVHFMFSTRLYTVSTVVCNHSDLLVYCAVYIYCTVQHNTVCTHCAVCTIQYSTVRCTISQGYKEKPTLYETIVL